MVYLIEMNMSLYYVISKLFIEGRGLHTLFVGQKEVRNETEIQGESRLFRCDE